MNAPGTVPECFADARTSLSQIENADDIDAEMENILKVQQEKHPHSLLHSVAFY